VVIENNVIPIAGFKQGSCAGAFLTFPVLFQIGPANRRLAGFNVGTLGFSHRHHHLGQVVEIGETISDKKSMEMFKNSQINVNSNQESTV
jgi:hypothetical protein